MCEFLRASAAWAEANMNEWPWGGPKDEDDEYYFIAPNHDAVIQKSAPDLLASHKSGERDPLVMTDWAGADTALVPRC